jgi:hypothetical protein
LRALAAASGSRQAKLANFYGFDKRHAAEHRIIASCMMNRWAKFVGLLLIVVVLVIVIAPDFDLPPTAGYSSARLKIPRAAAFNAIIPASIALLSPKSLTSPVRVGRPGPSYGSTSLIDRNCTRRC